MVADSKNTPDAGDTSGPRRRSRSPARNQDAEEYCRVHKQRMTWSSCWRYAKPWERAVVLFGVGWFLSLFGECARRCSQWRQLWMDRKMYIEGMTKGWMFGLPEDLSDPQWRTLRKFFPILAGGLVVQVVVSSFIKRLEATRSGSRAAFYAITGVVFVLVLHGKGALWNLLASGSCYLVGHYFGRSQWNPILTWAICVWVKWASDYYRGFEDVRFRELFGGAGLLVDRQGGLYAWQVQFNLTMLRLVSFNTERYWSLRRAEEKGGDGVELLGKQGPPTEPEDCTSPADFSVANFLAYVYYIPLYIAGPICRFPSWIDQVRRPREGMPWPKWLRKMLWVVCYVLLVELLLHVYVYVSVNNNRTWRRIQGASMPGWEVAFGGFATLQFMYCKFTCIWRFFRLWSVADGVDVPENMNRCVNMNYSFEGFWRQWHASLNQWIIRYMYIPMGGRKNNWWSVWVIFSFVGLWHDLMWRWLAWAWLNCFFFSAENAVVRACKHKALDALKQQRPALWMAIVTTAGAVNQNFLIFSNLAIMHGFQGSVEFLRNIVYTRDGKVDPGFWTFLGLLWLFFYVLVTVNLILRRVEAAHGINKRY